MPENDVHRSSRVTRVLAPLLTLAIGFIFSFLPYLTWWHRTSHFTYIADFDNEYYLQLASRLYFGNPFSMRDVAVPSQPTIYQAPQFAPAVWLVRLLHLPVIDVNLIWHLWSAAAVALALYFLFLHWLRSPGIASVCAVIILSDSGTATGGPIVFQIKNALQALTGHLPPLYDGQDLFGQWRFVDPAIGLPLLLAQVLVISSLMETDRPKRMIVAAGVLTAALFYTWFYYWTVVVAGLGLAFILHRNARATYTAILGIGLLGGFPSIIGSIFIKRSLLPDAMRRIGLFIPLPRLSVFLLPKVALLILAATGVWIWRKPRHEGLYLWCLALAGLLLENNHIITGINLLGGHWRFIWGPAASILFITMLAQLMRNRWSFAGPATTLAVACFIIFECVAGIALRRIEIARSINGALVLNSYKKFVQQTQTSGPQPLPPGAVIAGDSGYCDLATIFDGTIPFAGYPTFLSLSLSDSAWEFREAFNAHLLGLDEDEFRNKAIVGARGYAWGESDPRDRQKVEQDLMRAYTELDNSPDSLIKKFDIGYVAIPATRPTPDYLKRGWTLLVAGPFWHVWAKER